MDYYHNPVTNKQKQDDPSLFGKLTSYISNLNALKRTPTQDNPLTHGIKLELEPIKSDIPSLHGIIQNTFDQLISLQTFKDTKQIKKAIDLQRLIGNKITILTRNICMTISQHETNSLLNNISTNLSNLNSCLNYNKRAKKYPVKDHT
jgi:hypothetical protein